MRDPTKDVAIAFAGIMTMATIWSFLEANKAKRESAKQAKALEQKLDTILARLGKG